MTLAEALTVDSHNASPDDRAQAILAILGAALRSMAEGDDTNAQQLTYVAQERLVAHRFMRLRVEARAPKR
jgi:hypothetical protein